MLFTFEDLNEYCELNPENEKVERLCFESAYAMIEKYIGYHLEEQNHNELHTVMDNRILLNHINIEEIISIIDQNTKEQIVHCVIDYENKAIIFINCKYNGHVMFVNYNTGFTKATLPAPIKEAIVDLTLAKINEFAHRKNGQEECRIKDVPDPLKETLRPYTRKCL